jgi:NAD(P)-dependent dehydrogenase (short-subunit alcohol dehydrogenase family)
MRVDRARSLVLVTGVTGFSGREVVRHLLASGRRVVAMARSQQGELGVARVAKAVGLSPAGCWTAVVCHGRPCSQMMCIGSSIRLRWRLPSESVSAGRRHVPGRHLFQQLIGATRVSANERSVAWNGIISSSLAVEPQD